MSAVTIRESVLETKGWVTFSAGGPNKSRAWNKKLPEVGLTQSIVEELYLTSTQLGYNRDFDLRMHPDDFAAYNAGFEPRIRVKVVNLVNF